MKRVLIIEDSGMVCSLFRAALAGVRDLEVHTVWNARAAADRLARLGETDIVLLDMELPFVDLVAFLADYVPAASARPPTLVICTEACAGDVERDLAARTRAVA